MTSIEPELWVDQPSDAVTFYESAFEATPLMRVGEGDDIVARLAVGDARFRVATADPGLGRFAPGAVGGATGRILLVVDDPDAVQSRAVAAGATESAAVEDEHGWRLGRLIDPYGHEWEIGRPL